MCIDPTLFSISCSFFLANPQLFVFLDGVHAFFSLVLCGKKTTLPLGRLPGNAADTSQRTLSGGDAKYLSIHTT